MDERLEKELESFARSFKDKSVGRTLLLRAIAYIRYLQDSLDDVRLYEVQMKDGEIDMTLGSENCNAFIYSILQLFKQNGGKNFVSTSFEVGDKENKERYALIIQKVGSLTPVEKARQTTAEEILTEIDNALHDLGVEYANSGYMEYFAVCENIHHKIIRKIAEQYGAEVK